MDNNDNYNYRLYKSVFCNTFLSNLIYAWVYKINKIITSNSKTFKQTASYSESNFDWMVENKHWELLVYKIKKGDQIIDSNETTCLNFFKFFKFIMNEQQDTQQQEQQQEKQQDIQEQTLKSLVNYSFKGDDELLNLFYLNNKQILLNKDSNFYKSVSTRNMNCYEFAIKVGSLQLLKLLYQDIGPNNDRLRDYNNQISILEISLGNGNLEIIKYIHKVMKLGLADLSSFSIINAIESNNRSRVLEYLLDYLKFVPVKLVNGKGVYKVSRIMEDNLLSLEYPLFKRIIKLYPHTPIDQNPLSLLNYNNSFKSIPFKNILNMLQCLLHYCTISQKEKTVYTNIQNKLNWLINYNDKHPNRSGSGSGSTDINSNGWISNLKSKLSKSNDQPTTTTTPIGINLNNYNFEREVKRIYIFDYFETTNIPSVNCYSMKINFVREYGEYQLISQEFEKVENGSSIKTLNSPVIQFLQEFIKVSCFYGDSNLIEKFIELTLGNQSFIKEYSISKLTDTKRITNWLLNPDNDTLNKDISLQTKNISLFCKYSSLGIPIYKMFQCLFKNINKYYNNEIIEITNSGTGGSGDNKLKEQLNEINSIIKQYNFGNNKVFFGDILTCNFNIFKYYHCKHRDLFEFDSIQIGVSVVETSNLEFIQYLYDNNIGCLSASSSIDYCKNLQVAKLMYEKLNFKFTIKALLQVSLLNEIKSGYLFKYVLDKLIIQFLNDNSGSNSPTIKIQIPISSFEQPIQLDYIKYKFENGLLNNSNCVFVTCKYTDQIQNYASKSFIEFQYLFEENNQLNINYLIENGKFETLKQFFKQIKLSPADKQCYNTQLTQQSLKKINEIHSSFPIKSFIEKKLKNNKLTISPN